MAGIGFSLKRLFHKKGILNLCKAYGYSGIVTVGPMFLGVLLLLGVSFVARIGGMNSHDRDLLNCMLTYSLLASLLISSIFNMVVTRFVSDRIYEEKQEEIMPSFYGCVVLELIVCIVTYGVFLLFSGAKLLHILLCLWFAMVMIVVWTEMIYMTALKDFQAIVLSFAISLMFAFLLALLFVLFGWTSLESLFLCVIIGYGILSVRYLRLMLEYFPKSEGSCFAFLRWFDKYPTLALCGFMVRFGLFSHIIVMYFGPLQIQVEGLFYNAPEYEIPALIAFFSLLVSTISFVVSVEVNFYPKYSSYYGLFTDRGAIGDIYLAGKEMLDMLQREIIYLGCKQLFTTVLFIVLGPPVFKLILPGMSSNAIAIYKFLCAGYGTYAIANSLMLIELYFEDYGGALIGSTVFSIIGTGFTIWQVAGGDVGYFGVGFFAGCIAFYFLALAHLDWFTRRLPYFLLSKQSLVPGQEKGLFSKIGRWAETRYEKKHAKA